MRIRESGFSVHEGLLTLALLGLVLLTSVPSVANLRNEARMSAGARELAMTFRALRWKSVASNGVRGLYFLCDARGWYWHEVQDGNGNGLRTAELRSGTDKLVSGPHRLEERISGITLGFPPREQIPKIPPKAGFIGDLADPVKFGSSNIVSFSPLGTATGGGRF